MKQKTGTTISLLRVLLLFTAILILEIYKLFNGESMYLFLLHVTLFFNLLFCSYKLIGFTAFILLVYQGFEVVCYHYYNIGINFQFILNLDPKFAIEHLSVLLSIGTLVIIGIIFTFYPIKGCRVERTEMRKLFSLAISLFLFFPFAIESYKVFNPISNIEAQSENNGFDQKQFVFDKLDKFYSKKMSAKFKDNGSKRNIIIMEIESMEKGTMGIFNPKYKDNMPFMSQLFLNSTSVDYVPKSLYSDWSVASMFASQCNLPLMVSSPRAQGYFHLYPKHRCIGDYLKLLGYNLISIETGFFVGDFAKHLRMHNWHVRDRLTRKDTETFRFIIDKLFPTLKEPFALHISNTDTHHYPYFAIDRRCKKRVSSYPQFMRCFDCFDQVFEKFYNEFKKSKFANNTEFFIYSDHIMLTSVRGHGFENRSLTVMIPTRPKQLIKKKATIYDISPTIMDLIGVEIDPPFIFGESLLSDKVGMGINSTFVKYLYDYYSNGFKFDGNLSNYEFDDRGNKFNKK